MPAPLQVDSRRQIVDALALQLRRREGAARPPSQQPLSTGSDALDRWLPDGGFRRGTLVEWLSAGEGSGAATLALHSAREACRGGGALVMIDRRGEFYPPAAAGLGIDLARTILVRPRRADDELWALDQALRCEGVGAVWSWLDALDDHPRRPHEDHADPALLKVRCNESPKLLDGARCEFDAHVSSATTGLPRRRGRRRLGKSRSRSFSDMAS